MIWQRLEVSANFEQNNMPKALWCVQTAIGAVCQILGHTVVQLHLRTMRDTKMGSCIGCRARLLYATNSAMPPLKWNVSASAAEAPLLAPLPLLLAPLPLPLPALLPPLEAPRVSYVMVAVRFRNATSRSLVRMVSTSKVTLHCTGMPRQRTDREWFQQEEGPA